MKKQLDSLRKKGSQILLDEQTPIKEACGKPGKQRDASEKVSDNQSNNASHRNLPMRLSSAERRRAKKDKARMTSCSSSVERVIWEPDANVKDSNRVVPLR